MHIIELVIDGFKSYAVRTTITGWDESFNAITGLNGSGKSNVLDAICFCLGIQKYDLLRADGGASGLIYKRGTAGVTKASVTLVFDNSDKTRSPIGHEHQPVISITRQIVLGGTSKFLINGNRAQLTSVQTLFQSVQLNINNPTFLIMQGRITKVLNMKSTEILAMVEEAAGTRMFEDRREKSLRIIEKKQSKIDELKSVLNEEIEPKLEKLRSEKRAFLEFQNVQSELERQTKLVVAYDYIRSKQKVDQSAQDLASKRARVTALKNNADRLEKEIGRLQEDVEKVREARDRELRKGGKYAKLEEAVKSHSHELAKLATGLEYKTASVAEERDRLEKAQASIKDLESQLEGKLDLHKQLELSFREANAELEKQKSDAEKKEELLQTLQTGISSNADTNGGYAGQLASAREDFNKAGTEIEQAKLKIAHLEARIKEDEPRARKAEQENGGLLKSLENLRSQAAKIQKELEKLGVQPDKEAEQQTEKSQIEKRIQVLQTEAEALRRKLSRLDFTYSDPEPGFDRSRVKGQVARLFTLPTESTEASTALEVCAGGKLYNVVVDTVKTSSQLIDRGNLKRRVTVIPLDKIDGSRASANQVSSAQKLAPDKVHLALSLIGYAPELEKAMVHVFGRTLICADESVAKVVTFDKSVRMKSVTVEGDVYDPHGTISGGSAPQGSGVLLTLQKLNAVTEELELEQEKLSVLREAIARDAQRMIKAKQLKKDLDLKTHEISLAESQIANNSSSSIIASVQEMRETIQTSKDATQSAKQRQSEAQKEIKRIEKDMKDFSSNKGAKLEQLQTDLKKVNVALAKAQASIKPLQQQVRDAGVDVEQTNSDISAAQEELRDAGSAVNSQEEEVTAAQTAQAEEKEKLEYAQAALDDERKKLSSFNEEIAELERASKQKTQQISDEKLEGQKLGHEIDNFAKIQAGAQQAVTNLENEHDWISEECSSFGRPGTPYDFNGHNMSEYKSNLKNTSERFKTMKKKINPAVMATIDSVEKQESIVKQKMRTVIRDKEKLIDAIAHLDGFKKEALYKTWSKVNKDFGLIFNDLLPGNTAKLDPPEGKEITEGLEVKVCLGKVWKQSLTELSGGQRSLIALSLILALLQYSPAPMYILDEVDAALDLSHTQNIGRLIRTRFNGSQFIVVSLKDGMFSNANRIFKTRFVDGTSVVQALTPAEMR